MKNIATRLNFWRMFLSTVLLVGVVSACSDDDPPLPDNVVAFQSGELGIATDESELEVKISLSRAVDEALPLTVSFLADGLVYGEDFIIDPAPVGNTFQLTIPAGASDATFVLEKKEGVLLDGDEKITFTVASTSSAVVVGTQQQLVVAFAEILSQGSVLDVDGGGATFGNKVFIDLSANRQTAVQRTAWDLGFYMEGDDFYVTLNSSVTMMARALDKTDLTTVTAEDTVGFKSEMVMATADGLSWIDDPTGDLTNTAFAPVSATALENKVYIVNRGAGIGSPGAARGWKKVRVLRNGTGYTVQHADIAAANFSEIQITREDAYHFKHILFETGVVDAAPGRNKWDLAWTYFVNTTSFGADIVPYAFQDVVLQNSNVEAAKVLTADIAYNNFDEGDLAGLTFSSSQIAIGSDWRRTSPSPAIVYDDRYYVVKDASGNYYKLKFNLILRDGVRGNPQFEYVLVKAAN